MANPAPRPVSRFAGRLCTLLVPTAAFASFCLLAALPLHAADGIEQRFDVAPGGRLEVDSEGASVAITTGDAATARVSITRGRDDAEEILEDYRVDITSEGNLLRIDFERRKPWRLFDFRHEGPEIEVELPRRFDVDIVTTGGSVAIEDLDGGVDARTSGGSISLQAIAGPVMASTSGGSIRLARSGGDADLRTSGGSISIGAVEGSVRAKTSGGSITIDRAAGPVEATTSGGSIEIEEVLGAIDASTSGGSVRAYLSQPPGADSQLRTSGGSVTVFLEEGIGVDLDARASGRVTSQFDVADGGITEDDELVGAVNGGGPALVLRSSGGGIRLLRR